MKRVLRWVIPLLILGGLGVGAWFLFGPGKAGTDTTQVRRITVKKGELVETASASGTIAPHVQVEVKSRASGEVVEILVTEGQRVEAGQLLVRLDPGDYDRALESTKVDLRRVEAQLEQSQAALAGARLQQVEAKAASALSQKGTELGVVAGSATRTANSTTKLAAVTIRQREADIKSVTAQIDAAKVAVALAERKVGETRISAPFAGTILAINVEKGTIVASAVTNVSGGSGLLTLADLTDLRVTGLIDEAQIAKVLPGQEVKVQVDAYPDRTFEGHVDRVAALGVSVSNVVTFEVEIIVTDKDKSLLRSGMSADVEIVIKKTPDALLIPLTAVGSRGADRYVKLADGTEHKIQTGATDGSRIQVTSGLAEGDTIQAVAVTQRAAPPAGGASPIPGMGGPPRGGRN